MKLRHIVTLFIFVLGCFILRGQTLEEAKKLYLEGRYAEALPIFQTEYLLNPNDASLNQWLGVCFMKPAICRMQNNIWRSIAEKFPKHTSIWGNLRKCTVLTKLKRSLKNIRK